ncbi:TA system VapC family ribonuclease toxin [Sphingobium phenoxybenzoativorans]|uniref:TA system VapC family ribonuclease toxin n=1 Tax=Sphingobium phenoxybenzoativorans TaxID=1592790 RepID=UPI0008727ADA|nr:TA system VapC family ribonuclease toxin [Sphingobium phenoxybenzoativorans]
MTFLLDVNVLIALIDPSHVGHEAAHHWFEAEGSASWASCPITQNGLIRIVGHPKYPNSPGSPASIAPILRSLCALPGHIFWPDAIDITASGTIDMAKILTHAQVTDTYLLALAAHHGGQLATFDRRLATAAVSGGRKALRIIEGLTPA